MTRIRKDRNIFQCKTSSDLYLPNGEHRGNGASSHTRASLASICLDLAGLTNEGSEHFI